MAAESGGMQMEQIGMRRKSNKNLFDNLGPAVIHGASIDEKRRFSVCLFESQPIQQSHDVNDRQSPYMIEIWHANFVRYILFFPRNSSEEKGCPTNECVS